MAVRHLHAVEALTRFDLPVFECAALQPTWVLRETLTHVGSVAAGGSCMSCHAQHSDALPDKLPVCSALLTVVSAAR
jgi:hypothetical protein